jgi:hypothetical protein
MSAYQDNGRQGKLFIAGGVAALVSGSNEAPPQWSSSYGTMSGLAQIAGLLMLGGLILTVIGVIRYAQSGSDGRTLAFTPAPAGPAVAAMPVTPAPVVVATSAAPVSTLPFCSSCGARITGEGRFCSSCGTSTAH